MKRYMITGVVLVILAAIAAGALIADRDMAHPASDVSGKVNNAISNYDTELASCHAFANGSSQTVRATTRLLIYLPKKLYSLNDRPLSFRTQNGDAKASWVSSAGPMGEAFSESPDCYAYYYEFDGTGEIDLLATTSVTHVPAYAVHFTVK